MSVYSYSSRSRRHGGRAGRPNIRPSGRGGFGGRGGGNRKPEIDVKRLITSFQNAAPQVEVVHEIKHKFTDFNIANGLKANIAKRGFTDPTPIQDQAIPPILEGKDLVGIANTGTGKSAAFLIPLINKVAKDPQQKVLIMAPTRELALQILEEMQALCSGSGIYGVSCVGGMNINRQISDIRRRHNFVIGTPGRLKDLVNRGILKLENFNSVVLDEVDRMLDMGFIVDMQYLIAKLPKERQSLFFSATLTGEVETVMQKFVNDYVKVSVKTGETAANVKQEVVEINAPEDKLPKLYEILDNPEVKKVLIFVRTKRAADRMESVLIQKGYKAEAIHGDKRQSQRQRTLNNFKSGRLQVLVATDVAARGLDISGLTHVINYELPDNNEDYVHRIGRVGRAGNKGVAISFATPRRW